MAASTRNDEAKKITIIYRVHFYLAQSYKLEYKKKIKTFIL